MRIHSKAPTNLAGLSLVFALGSAVACGGTGGADSGTSSDVGDDSSADGTLGSGGGMASGGTDTSSGGLTGTGGAFSSGGAAASGGTLGSGGDVASGGTIGSGGTNESGGAAATGGAASGGSSGTEVTAASLIAALGTCTQISTGKYASDSGGTANIPVCGLGDVVWWKADMDVDCDGKTTAVCNGTADPWYQNQTSATDSNGDPLDASTLPYVVIPSASSRFKYADHDIQLGQVVAVIYNGKITYAVFGDTGPNDIIGEASYATAASLGIDSNPETGGTDGPVYYVVFTGATGRVSPIESHSEAVSVGTSRAEAFLAN